MKISVNINDYAVVRLTSFGIDTYRKHYTELASYSHEPNKHLDFWMGQIKDDGTLKVPLWDLMHIFGDEMVMGEQQLFKNNEVIIINDTNPVCGCGGC